MRSKTKALFGILALALAMGAAAKDKIKPWTEWNKKDAEKILNDSAWGQTQTETDSSEMTWSTATRPIDGRGALNQATSLTLYIRFISAKPIRQAMARLAELDTGRNTPQQIQNARDFIDQKFDKTVVVSVNYESKDGRFQGPAFQALNSAITNTLKNNTYLELKGGKRVFLQEYQPPTQGTAMFIFPRIVDDKPLLDPKSGDIRFWAEFPNRALMLNMRFKVADMMYNGVLEY